MQICEAVRVDYQTTFISTVVRRIICRFKEKMHQLMNVIHVSFILDFNRNHGSWLCVRVCGFVFPEQTASVNNQITLL